MEEESIRRLVREEILERELRRINSAYKGFYIHLAIYCIVNAAFSVFVLLRGGFFWPIYPIVFWGAGVLVHFSCLSVAKKSVESELESLK